MTTDHKRVVLAKYPDAEYCFSLASEPPEVTYYIKKAPRDTVEIGSGSTEAAAWQDARKKLEAQNG